MANVLIVDDSPLDRRLATRLLEDVGIDVVGAEHGKDAIAKLADVDVELVLTDMHMPEMDGLQLVKELSQIRPSLPVILMTAFGSEEIAVQALQHGAASYVPKQNLTRNLAATVKSVLAIARAKRDAQSLVDSMRQVESEYVLPNSLDGLDTLVGYIKEQLRALGLFGETDLLRVGTALYEALVNAIEHGNLEIKSESREQPAGSYRQLLEERAADPVLQTRHVYLTSKLSHDDAVFVVRDEGPGFDPSTLPDPTDAENVGKVNGRGLFLIQTFMDDIHFNDTGNALTMVKRRSQPTSP